MQWKCVCVQFADFGRQPFLGREFNGFASIEYDNNNILMYLQA